jgi:adenylate cyclase, class 2
MFPHSGHEIEIKLRVADLAALRRRLRALGARPGPRFHEINVLFDTPDQSLRRREMLLRLRVECRPSRSSVSSTPEARRARVNAWLFPPRAPRHAIVTLKAPPATSVQRGAAAVDPGSSARQAYKIRREIEFEAPDSVAFREILIALGFHPAFYYEKLRTTFRLPHLLISLDETPVGIFLELEGRPASIDRARAALGYRPQDSILLSYGALYAAHCAARGQPPGDMLF